LAERIAHPLSLELVFLLRAMLHLDRREPEPALRLIGATETLVTEGLDTADLKDTKALLDALA